MFPKFNMLANRPPSTAVPKHWQIVHSWLKGKTCLLVVAEEDEISILSIRHYKLLSYDKPSSYYGETYILSFIK